MPRSYSPDSRRSESRYVNQLIAQAYTRPNSGIRFTWKKAKPKAKTGK